MKKIKVAAAVAFNEEGKILICKRGSEGHMARHWEFPGGKIEAAETAEDAVIRECREELNLEPEDIWPYAMFAYDYPDRHIDFTFFLCRAEAGDIERRVHSDVRWVEPEALPDFDFCPADRRLIARLAREYATS